MWALVESGSVSKVYTRPTKLTLGDIQYPSNIFMLWTSSELEAIGIYEVVIDNTNYKDPEYYINTNQSFASIWSSAGVGVKAQISDAPDITQGANCINFKVKSNIFYSYEVGSVGNSPSGLTGGVASLYL